MGLDENKPVAGFGCGINLINACLFFRSRYIFDTARLNVDVSERGLTGRAGTSPVDKFMFALTINVYF